MADAPAARQERLLHFGLTGARRFYYFNVFYACLYGDRTTREDNDVLSSALAELDAMVGCAASERHWLPDARVRPPPSRFRNMKLEFALELSGAQENKSIPLHPPWFHCIGR